MKSNFLDFQLFPLSDWQQLDQRLSGNNNRHILVVIEHGENQEALTDFLEKILGASKLSLAEDTLLFKVTKGENISFSSLRQSWPIQYVLLFGVKPRQLGLHFALPLHQPVKFGAAHFLYSPSLKTLFEERKAKTRPQSATLWNNLKQLFLDPGNL